MQRNTRQRNVIQEIVRTAARPLSPSEIFSLAREILPTLSMATVYRYINSLVSDGRLVAVSLPGAPDRYETKESAEIHHHHFHCNSCGKVFDIPGCGLKIEKNIPAGFSVQRHEVVLYGECGGCTPLA